MSSYDTKIEVLNEVGFQLYTNPDLYQQVRKLLEAAWQEKYLGGTLEALKQKYVDAANRIGFPSEHRTRKIIDEVNTILTVADRFFARQALANAYGVAEFHVGMSVIVHQAEDLWVEGDVEKLHPNGRFTFKARNKKGVTADPRQKVTVRINF